MNGQVNNFKIKSATFDGYVKRALEDIGKNIGEINSEIKSINKRITNIQIKVAGIGAVVSFVVTILVILIKEIITK